MPFKLSMCSWIFSLSRSENYDGFESILLDLSPTSTHTQTSWLTIGAWKQVSGTGAIILLKSPDISFEASAGLSRVTSSRANSDVVVVIGTGVVVRFFGFFFFAAS